MPREAGEEIEDALKRNVSHAQRMAYADGVLLVLFQLVRQKQATVEVGNLAGEGFGFCAAISHRLGKGFEEQRLEELAKETVSAALLAFGQLGSQVVGITTIQKKLLL